MRSFLEEVVEDVWQKYTSVENIVFVLPSKRAGFFLKSYIAKKATTTIWSPQVYSIESFVEEVSGLTYASGPQQLFELYNSYLAAASGEKDGFYTFSKWGLTLLQDFNELDRYLVDTSKLFNYLSAVQELNHWYLQKERTPLIENYIRFWNHLEPIYEHFNQELINKGLGSQGLVYRRACSRLTTFLEESSGKKYIFIGFNALNSAESYLIQKMLETGDASIYWDIDPYFVNDPINDAGHFIRQHQLTWKYFKEHPLKGLRETYLNTKNIKVIGVPKNVSQAKYVGSLLSKLQESNAACLEHTAIVLGNENLLNPLLNSIPKQIKNVNITMGYPLDKTHIGSLFSQFFDLYLHQQPQGWFYRNVLAFLSHPSINTLFTVDDRNLAKTIIATIEKRNWIYINIEKIGSLSTCATDSKLIHLLFSKEPQSPSLFIEKCLELIGNLRIRFQQDKNDLGLEHLYRFYQLFGQLKDLISIYPFISDLKSLLSLYKELLSSETLDFQGEPMQGLQVMGMLESRNLDFETIIITSVNEGILPSGKSNNSFIPYDIKQDFKLPTYKEKDAVYTYHFYRLLQRAKNVYLLYNTEPDVLEGGEKSRLITQLLTDENRKDITQTIAVPDITPTVKRAETIIKNKALVQQILSVATKGLSPTSLSNYIRNPIDFYKKSILKIDDSAEVEETIAANTFGTIVHESLEELYKPLLNKYLTQEMLQSIKVKIKGVVQSNFSRFYAEVDISKGKNLIAYHVIVRYIENFIGMEMEDAQKHQVKIIGLEEKLKLALHYPEIKIPIILNGKLDRIDEKDGTLRIIDYKTGKVEQRHLKVTDWEELITNYDKSKAFQLMCYALMYQEKHSVNSLQAGIYSFKNLKGKFMPFQAENTIITKDTLTIFQVYLKKLVLEICDPSIPFIEKEV